MQSSHRLEQVIFGDIMHIFDQVSAIKHVWGFTQKYVLVKLEKI